MNIPHYELNKLPQMKFDKVFDDYLQSNDGLSGLDFLQYSDELGEKFLGNFDTAFVFSTDRKIIFTPFHRSLTNFTTTFGFHSEKIFVPTYKNPRQKNRELYYEHFIDDDGNKLSVSYKLATTSLKLDGTFSGKVRNVYWIGLDIVPVAKLYTGISTLTTSIDISPLILSDRRNQFDEIMTKIGYALFDGEEVSYIR